MLDGCVYAKSNGVDDDRSMQSGATSHAKWFDMEGEHHSHTQWSTMCQVTNSTCCKVVHNVLSDRRIHKAVCHMMLESNTICAHRSVLLVEQLAQNGGQSC